MKILYLYSGERKKRFKGVAGIDYPDTQFYGLNHFKALGIFAEFKEPSDLPLGHFLEKIFGFRIKHLLMYFIAIRYDIVFGISIIYMLALKKIIPTKTKFVLFNSVLNRMLTVYKPESIRLKLLVWILKEVDGIIFLANDHKNKVTERISFLKDRSFFVPMGVDAVYYKPVFDDRDSYFLSVGRDNARDYKTVVEVAKKMPNEEFRFVCLPRNLKGISGIPPNVKVYSDISIGELSDMYKKAKALLLITHDDSYIEGSDSSGPTVLLEAMAIGLPIIASRKGYLKDYVEDGRDALLVNFYDANGIIEKIRIVSGKKYANGLAINARKKIDSVFNTYQMALGISKVFRQLYDKR